MRDKAAKVTYMVCDVDRALQLRDLYRMMVRATPGRVVSAAWMLGPLLIHCFAV